MGKCFWQKTKKCEMGCGYYVVRDDKTEACTKYGYRLHPDWIKVADDCEDFLTAEQIMKLRKDDTAINQRKMKK